MLSTSLQSWLGGSSPAAEGKLEGEMADEEYDEDVCEDVTGAKAVDGVGFSGRVGGAEGEKEEEEEPLGGEEAACPLAFVLPSRGLMLMPVNLLAISSSSRSP